MEPRRGAQGDGGGTTTPACCSLLAKESKGALLHEQVGAVAVTPVSSSGPKTPSPLASPGSVPAVGGRRDAGLIVAAKIKPRLEPGPKGAAGCPWPCPRCCCPAAAGMLWPASASGEARRRCHGACHTAARHREGCPRPRVLSGLLCSLANIDGSSRRPAAGSRVDADMPREWVL